MIYHFFEMGSYHIAQDGPELLVLSVCALASCQPQTVPMCSAYLRSMFAYGVKEGSRLMSFPYRHYFNIKQEQHNRPIPIVKHWTCLLQIKSLLVGLFLDSLFCDISPRILPIFSTIVLCISKINFISSCQFLQLNKLKFFDWDSVSLWIKLEKPA